MPQSSSRFLRLSVSAVAACLAALLFAFPQLHAASASTCEWNGVERVVAIGDVHGAYDRYLEILRTTGIIDAGGHWSGGRTHFVQLGDVVDRGDDSRRVLDLLRRLEREAPPAGGFTHLLLGNHEAARMLGDLRLTTAGEYAAFANPDSATVREKYLKAISTSSGPSRDEMLEKTPLGLVEMRQAFGREGEYGRWLRQLPVIIKIDGIAFVHGGISPAVAPLGCAAINEQVRRELTSDLDKTRANPLASLVARADGPLWYRGLAQESEAFAPQVTEILARLGARAVVIAHTVTENGRIRTRFDAHVIQIDTGMQPAYVAAGRASALEIHDGEASAVYTDRRDPVVLGKTAATAQERR